MDGSFVDDTLSLKGDTLPPNTALMYMYIHVCTVIVFFIDIYVHMMLIFSHRWRGLCWWIIHIDSFEGNESKLPLHPHP